MGEAHWLDWVYIALLSLIIPANAAKSYSQLLPRLRLRERGIREAVYLSSIVSQWLFVAILVAWWWYQGRDFHSLQLNLPRANGLNLFWLTLILAYTALIYFYTLRILADPQKQLRWYARLQESPGVDITPAEGKQLKLWWLVSLTAGFCEEFVYRAFLMWLLGIYMEPLWALPIMALIFGLGHRYQGTDGIFLTSLLGLLMGVIYLSSGSLWLAVLCHAMIDASHGWAAYRIYHNYRAMPHPLFHDDDEDQGSTLL